MPLLTRSSQNHSPKLIIQYDCRYEPRDWRTASIRYLKAFLRAVSRSL